MPTKRSLTSTNFRVQKETRNKLKAAAALKGLTMQRFLEQVAQKALDESITPSTDNGHNTTPG